MAATITISFSEIDTKDIDSIDISFKDGRPTMSKMTTRPDENGKMITVSTTMPYEAEKPEYKSKAKKVEK